MRPIALPLILAAALAGSAASAQSTDSYAGYGTAPPAGGGYGQQGYPPPGYAQGDGGYGDQGQAPGYGNAPPPGGTAYRDDERWGSQDSYGSADARPDEDGPASGWQGRGGPAPGYPGGYGQQSPRTRAYAARVARWRARADACEAGDIRACQGPDN
jgi:hypothetical protein